MFSQIKPSRGECGFFGVKIISIYSRKTILEGIKASNS